MRRNILFVASILGFLLVSKAALCSELNDLKIPIQRMQVKNKALQVQLNRQRKQLNRQKKIIEALQERMEGIERKETASQQGNQKMRSIVEEVLAEQETEKELADLFSEGGAENMIFHGYADFEWKSTEFDRAQGGSRGHNFFDNHHFNLWFGYVLADNLIAKGEIEIEHGGDEFKLEFGEIQWKPFSSDGLELLMGKIIVPLGIEHPVHATVRNKLISRPLPSRSIIPGTYGDIGIEARGWIPSMADTVFRYHLYVVNGIGDDDGDNIYEQKSLKRSRDNNDNKVVGGQIALLPGKWLELGGSGYFGKWDDNDENITYIMGSHLVFNRDPVEIRTEYIFQHIENANGPATGDANLYGWYFQGAYKLAGLRLNNFFNKWEVVARYDWINNDDGVVSLKQGGIPPGKSENRIAIGLIIRPQDGLQFKMEYLYRNNADIENDKGLSLQAVANW